MRARNRSSSVVARLSNVGFRAARAPVYGTVVSVFFGQPPRSDWCERMLAAIRLASAVANQASGFLRYGAGPVAATAGAARVRANSTAVRMGDMAGVRRQVFGRLAYSTYPTGSPA